MLIWYGKGFVSLVVIGGMWSFSLLAVLTIFIAVFRSIVSIALRTFVRSGNLSACSYYTIGIVCTAFCPRRGKRYIKRPLFPADLFFALREPRFLPPLLEELYRYLSSWSGVSATYL